MYHKLFTLGGNVKIRRLIVLTVLMLFALAACSEVTMADIQALQEKDAELEAAIAEVESPEPVFFEDPNLRVFLGDEDVTDLLDVSWIAKSDTGAVSFRVAVFDNALSDEHGGILYIVPSEEFTNQIEYSGYDYFSIGAAMLSSTYEESYIEDGFVKWIRLPEGHPMGRVPALVVFSESYGIFANEPIQRGPQIGIVFGIAYDKYDSPWHFYYGLDIIGSINVFQPR